MGAIFHTSLANLLSTLRTHWRVGVVALLLLRFGVYHYLSGHSHSPQGGSPSGTGHVALGGASASGAASHPREFWQRPDPPVVEPKRSLREILVPAARDSSQKLLDAASRGDVEEMKTALQQGANPNAAYEDSWETSLMLASRNGNIEAVRLLLAQPGINPYAENRNYETALTYAGNPAIRALLDAKGVHR